MPHHITQRPQYGGIGYTTMSGARHHPHAQLYFTLETAYINRVVCSLPKPHRPVIAEGYGCGCGGSSDY